MHVLPLNPIVDVAAAAACHATLLLLLPLLLPVTHLGVHHTLCICLWVTEADNVLALSQSNLLGRAVADEHRLATPLDSHSLFNNNNNNRGSRQGQVSSGTRHKRAAGHEGWLLSIPTTRCTEHTLQRPKQSAGWGSTP